MKIAVYAETSLIEMIALGHDLKHIGSYQFQFVLEGRDRVDREILAAAMETFAATSGSVALLNPDTGLLEIEVQQGLPDAADPVPLRPGQGVTGWVALHGRAQLVHIALAVA